MKRVTAGIVLCQDNVLIAQRKESKSLGLCWEFPGGKLEAGETLEECLKREFMEELKKEIIIDKFFMQSTYDYDFGTIELNSFLAHTDNQKIITHPDHEQVKWIKISEIDDYNFCPVDRPIVEQLKTTLK